MSSIQSPFRISATRSAARIAVLLAIAAQSVLPGIAAAGETSATNSRPSCSSPLSSRTPKFTNLLPVLIPGPLDAGDEIAALRSVQFALMEVADGATYVWHRNNGRLSGLVKPISSFKDAKGAVCRHILVVFNSASDTSKTETIACRLADGVWELDG
jgi:surface antigen